MSSKGGRPIWDDLLLSEPGFPGVPKLMISIEFDPEFARSRIVTLHNARAVPVLDERENYSDGP